jgi:hypothetical protein
MLPRSPLRRSPWTCAHIIGNDVTGTWHFYDGSLRAERASGPPGHRRNRRQGNIGLLARHGRR